MDYLIRFTNGDVAVLMVEECIDPAHHHKEPTPDEIEKAFRMQRDGRKIQSIYRLHMPSGLVVTTELVWGTEITPNMAGGRMLN